MDVSRLPIMIANPAEQAERYYTEGMNNWKERLGINEFHYHFFKNATDLKLHDLVPNEGVGKLLLIVNKYPNIDRYEFFHRLGTHPVREGELLEVGCMAKLINHKTVKANSTIDGHNITVSREVFNVTKLGLDVMKQNGLI